MAEADRGRVGLVVGVALVLAGLLAIGAIVLAQQDGDDTTTTLPTTTPTATATATATASVTVTPPRSTSTSTPTPTSEALLLRPDGVGPLEIGMSAQQAVATGAAERDTSVVTGERTIVADRQQLPGVIVSYSNARDAIIGFMVKDGSPIETPEGIGVDSTAADVRATYGPRAQEREEFGSTYFIVPSGDTGYAFFPTERQMIMVAATDERLATIKPNTEL